MSQSNEDKLEALSNKIHVLVVVLIVLAVILTAYMAVECALLFYSFYKKKKQYADPEKVVVKGDKSSKSGKSKQGSKSGKSKKSGKSSKSSKSSSRKQIKSKDSKSVTRKQKKPKRPSKVSQSSAKSSVAEKVEKPKKVEKAPPSSKGSGEGKTKTGKVVESLKTAVLKSGKEQLHRQDSDTRTEDQIRAIPNQFESPPTAKSFGSIDAASNDTKTEDQIRAIPNQFTPDARTARVNDSLLSDRALQQVVSAITAQLASKQSGAQSSLVTPSSQSRGQSEEVTPLSTPESQKQPLNVPAPVNVPQQPELPKPTPFAQPVPPSMGRQVDSVYIMEVGQNGEIQKANMPVEPAATNSLMIDAQNVVPINGKPDTSKPPGTAS